MFALSGIRDGRPQLVIVFEILLQAQVFEKNLPYASPLIRPTLTSSQKPSVGEEIREDDFAF